MKILIAEDDPVSRRLLEAFLRKWCYQVIAVAKGDDAWALLETADPPRMAILDWIMPGIEGVEICRRVRARSGHPYTFLILLTARGHKQNLLARPPRHRARGRGAGRPRRHRHRPRRPL